MVRLASLALVLAAVLASTAGADIASATPVNDDFAAATTLPPTSLSLASLTTDGATSEPFEPAAGASVDKQTVWFRWTPSHSGGTKLSACLGDFPDQVLVRAYTGATLAGLKPVPNVGSTGCDEGSTIDAVAGTTYSIQVDTRYLQGGSYHGVTGSLKLDQQLPSQDPTPALAFDPPGVTKGIGRITSNAKLGWVGACTLDFVPTPCAAFLGIPFSGLASGKHTVIGRFRNDYGNWGKQSSLTWTVDADAPDTTLTSPAIDPAAVQAPTFTFTSNDPGATFACASEDDPSPSDWFACSSPFTSSGAYTLGAHVLMIRAADAAGNVDPSPARVAWTHTAPPAATPSPAPQTPAHPTTTQPSTTPTTPARIPPPVATTVTGSTVAPPVAIVRHGVPSRAAITALKAGRHGVVTATLVVAGAGRVSVIGRAGTLATHRVARTFAGPRTTTIRLTPTAALAGALRRSRAATRLRVGATFTAPDGTVTTLVSAVTLRG